MSQNGNKNNLFSYLDKVMGQDGIKTTNKIDISVDSQTALTLFGIGIGLVIFSHAIGTGLRALTKSKSISNH